MSFKKILGTLSPAYGIATGQGMIGKLADKGLLGLGPRMIANEAQQNEAEKELARQQAEKEMQMAQRAEAMRAMQPQAMKKGGKVSYKSGGSTASKRADGCATKGKTRGRMV